MVLDRSHLAAIAVSVRMLLLLGLLLVISPRFGVVGVAYAIASVTCLMTIVDYAIAPRLLGIERRRFLAVVWRPIVAALANAAGVWILRFDHPPPSDVTGHAWSLFLTVVLGAIVYLTCLLALWRLGGRRDGPEQWVIRLVKERYARHLRSAA
jgi:O-antigen/teichoic acid export membrane protein